MKEVIRICIFGILLILAGCRSESLVEADELYREQIDKIKFFENYEKDKNHRYDEKWLNYEDTSNPAIPFSQSLKTLLVNRPEVAEVIKKHYGEIYWEATSVLMESEEGDKVVYYPIIGKGKDKNKYVLKSIVNKNHTYLRFEIQTKEKEKLASQMIDDFSKYLNDDEVMESRCVDRNGIPTCDIDAVEIIGRKNRGITVPLPPAGLAPANPPYYWDIGEGRYVGIECMNIGGCGSSLPLPIPPPMDNNDPCIEMKNMNNNPAYNEKIKELNKPSIFKQKQETGYVENRNGNFTKLERSESTSNSDGLNIPISKYTKGYTHTHQDDYETGRTDEDGNPEIRQPIRIHSTTDVNTIMEIAKLRDDGDYADIYGTMVASTGIYTIKFTGSKNDIKTGFDTDDWRNEFIGFMEKAGGSMEAKFLKFIKEKMGISGISLFKTRLNGKVQRIQLDDKNNVKKTDC